MEKVSNEQQKYEAMMERSMSYSRIRNKINENKINIFTDDNISLEARKYIFIELWNLNSEYVDNHFVKKLPCRNAKSLFCWCQLADVSHFEPLRYFTDRFIETYKSMSSASDIKKYTADILEKMKFDMERAHSLQHDITYLITQKIKTSARIQLVIYEQRLMYFYQILEDIKKFLLTHFHHIKLQEPQALSIYRPREIKFRSLKNKAERQSFKESCV